MKLPSPDNISLLDISIRNNFLHRYTAFIATEKRRIATATRRLNNSPGVHSFSGSSTSTTGSSIGAGDADGALIESMDIEHPSLGEIHGSSGAFSSFWYYYTCSLVRKVIQLVLLEITNKDRASPKSTMRTISTKIAI